MTTDLETRLRRDLPRLAETLADAPIATSIDGAAGGVPDRPLAVSGGRRRRPVLVAAAIVVVIAVVGAGLWTTRRDPSTTVVSDSTTAPPSSVPQPGRWTDIAPSPMDPAQGAAAVWTGTEVLVFGGYDDSLTGSVTRVTQSAAAYDPATDSWRELAPLQNMAPVVQVVWTGEVAVVLAKSGGDLYDPATDTWTRLPDQPGPPDEWIAFGQPVWTGDRLFAVGTTVDSATRQHLSVLDLDLETPSWIERSESGSIELPEGMFAHGGDPVSRQDSAWTGTELVVLAWDGSYRAYNPSSDSWRALPPVNGGFTPSAIESVDGQLYVVTITAGDGSMLSVGVLEGDEWRWLDEHWIQRSYIPGLTVSSTDRSLVVLGATDGRPAELDIATGMWVEPLPPLRSRQVGAATVWTGTQLFSWGGAEMSPTTDRSTIISAPSSDGALWTPSAP